MKTNYRLTLALLAAVVIGIAGGKLIYGQHSEGSPGYVIAEVQVTDLTAMRKYGEKMPETLAPFKHYLVRSGKPQSLSGGGA